MLGSQGFILMVLQLPEVSMGKVYPLVPFRNSNTWMHDPSFTSAQLTHFLLVAWGEELAFLWIPPCCQLRLFWLPLYSLRGPVLPDTSLRLGLGICSDYISERGLQMIRFIKIGKALYNYIYIYLNYYLFIFLHRTQNFSHGWTRNFLELKYLEVNVLLITDIIISVSY